MLKRLMKRADEEQGFTLIELMVVVLIIGILIAIALPTFLGARERAQDRGAQSNLRNGVAAAKVWYTDNETYVGFDDVEAEALEPSLTWIDLADPAINQVAVGLQSATDVQLVAESASGTFFCIRDNTPSGTTYDTGVAYADVDTLVECVGASW